MRGVLLTLAVPKAYIVIDPRRRQHEEFGAADGRVLWTLTKGQGYPAGANTGVKGVPNKRPNKTASLCNTCMRQGIRHKELP